MSVFGGLLETKEDLQHLPDGRTIRRLRTPHPNGVIFAFEDVSDRLATMRRLNELTDMQKSMLDNLNDAVVIFGVNQRLKLYNRAYLNLWSIDIDKMQDEPKLDKVLSYQKEMTQLICVIHNPILIYKLSKLNYINFIELTDGYLEEIKNVFDKL